MDLDLASSQEDVERKPWCEPVLAGLLEPEPFVPPRRGLGILRPKDGDDLLHAETGQSMQSSAMRSSTRSRSSSITVLSPWPVWTIVSPGRVSSRSRIERRMVGSSE